MRISERAATLVMESLSRKESGKTRATKRFTETHNNHIHWAWTEPTITAIGDWPKMQEQIYKLPEQILALGGPKHFEMLPYKDGRSTIIVPGKLRPIVWREETGPIDIEPISTEIYRVEKLGVSRHTKLIYVHESINVDEAMAVLQEGLLAMFISQPYA